MSAGCRRHRADYFVPNERPKRLWMKELCPRARAKVCAVPLAPEQAGACVAAAHGVLPLDQKQRRSLREVLRHAPDPRGKNTRFRIGPLLSIVAMALLGGARQSSEIARFATRLQPRQRADLGAADQKRDAPFLRSGHLQRLLRSAHPHGSRALRDALERLAWRRGRHPARRSGP